MEHPWSSALVTGASSGIGAAIATELGRAGTDLVLVAQRVDRLHELADRLAGPDPRSGPDRPAGAGRAGGPMVEVLEADLADGEARRRVADRLADEARPIDLLVNCAGLGAAGPFAEGVLDRYRQILDVNVDAVVELTHAAVGPMLARRRGWILNVSSLGGHAPGPGFAVYSATKAFVTSFSESLHEELRRAGIGVTVVCPGATRTEFGDATGASPQDLPGFLWQEPEQVAVEALAATAAGKAVRVTGTVNRVSAAFTTVLPRGANRRLAALVTDRL